LAKESLPTPGTIVEKYLTKHRGIKNIDSKDIKYHPKVFTSKNEKQKYMPAMLSIGRDKDGNVQCIQATYLDPKTDNKANLDVKKRTYASPSGALVYLQKQENNGDPKNKISFIAEGTETGLSIKDATGNIKNSEVVVTLGKSNFASIDPKSVGNKVVFCLDNDGPATLTDNTIYKAAERLISFGKEVFISIPGQAIGKSNEKSEKNVKIDFNDIAKTIGVDAVKNTLDNSVPYNEWKNNVEKITVAQKSEVNLSIADKIMRQDHYLPNNKLYNSLLKKPEIDLNAASKLIYSEQKNTLTNYLNTYNRTQNISSIQKNIKVTKDLSNHDIQKSLSKTEKDIC
jgi:hypothetical protein